MTSCCSASIIACSDCGAQMATAQAAAVAARCLIDNPVTTGNHYNPACGGNAFVASMVPPQDNSGAGYDPTRVLNTSSSDPNATNLWGEDYQPLPVPNAVYGPMLTATKF
jgi:hypothetical protein